MDRILEGKVIVVSGGTKGIGREIILECAKQGASVVIGGRDRIAGEEILEQVNATNGKGVFVNLDLFHIDECERLFAVAESKFNKVDGYVNYAGITPAASILDCEESLFDEIFDINIKAAFFCTKYAIKSMMKNPGGSIILFGSAHSWVGEKDRAAYAVSKGALFTLFEHISHHYASNRIRCNFLTMGWTPTEGELSLRKTQGISEIQLKEMASKVIPMGRMCKIEDHIPGIIYLLSDYSTMVTGSNLRITGGEYIY